MQNEEDQKIIQDYLHKRLGTKEIQSFLVRLRNDLDFKKEVLFAQYLHDAFKTPSNSLGSNPILPKTTVPRPSDSNKVSPKVYSPSPNPSDSFVAYPQFERQLATTRSTTTSPTDQYLHDLITLNQNNESSVIDISLKHAIEVDLEVKVYNNLGNVQKAYNQKSFLSKGQTHGQLSLQGLPPGCYYLRFKAGRQHKSILEKIFLGKK